MTLYITFILYISSFSLVISKEKNIYSFIEEHQLKGLSVQKEREKVIEKKIENRASLCNMLKFLCAYFEAFGLVLMLEVVVVGIITLDRFLSSILALHSQNLL